MWVIEPEHDESGFGGVDDIGRAARRDCTAAKSPRYALEPAQPVHDVVVDLMAVAGE